MRIEIIPCLQDNYSYLVIDEKKNNACVIDPGESAPIIKYLDDNKINLEIEKIANLMVHDDVSSDEQDITKLEKYRDQIKTDLNIDDEEAMKLVYETLVYRKLKSSDSSDMLEKGTDFGAGFS